MLIAALASGALACGQSAAPDAGPVDAGVDVARDTGAMDVPSADAALPDVPAAVDTAEASAPDVAPVDAGPCGPVIDLSTAGTVTGMTTRYVGDSSGAPMAAPVAASCGGADYEVFLSYVVHTASSLSVSVANAGTSVMFDTVLAARTSCLAGMGTELACDDDTLPDRRSSLSATVAAGQTIYIVVAGSTTSGTRYVDHGPFELTVTENPLGGPCDPTALISTCGAGFECVATAGVGACVGYSESVIASPTWIDACATGTQQTLSGRDDGHTPTLTLPFPFTYYGAAQTSASADTNGYLLFGATTPSDNYGAAFPIGDGPLLAPFHDDLVIQDAPAGAICTLTVGTGATQQYVVEWMGATRYEHTTVSLTFELVLSATTNTIDYVYHVLSGTGADAPYATGTTAAIGLEGDGDTALVHHPAGVSTTSGLRFTPLP